MTAVCDTAPTTDQSLVLRRGIADVCIRIDRRLGNRPGTAERAIWFWYGPPYKEFDNVPVLTRFYADALTLLHTLTPTTKDHHHA